MKIYRKISSLETNTTKTVGTVISEDYIGSKAIWMDDKLIYSSNERVSWPEPNDFRNQDNNIQLYQTETSQIFIETLLSEKKLVICGAGHISMPIIKMGKMLDFHVVVIDDRPKFANDARRENADLVLCEPFSDALDKIKSDENTFFIIVTRGHKYDQDCLEKIIEKKNAYIGMIGSKKRVGLVLKELIDIGKDALKLNKVCTPIGLDIKAETPEEIAVAIMAEIIKVKNTKSRTVGYSKEIIQEILNEDHDKNNKALVTIISKKGSAPRDIGTKMIVLEDGTTVGTIGGGCVEAELIHTALYCIKNQITKVEEYDMTGREAEEDGMVCGGIIKVLIDPIN